MLKALVMCNIKKNPAVDGAFAKKKKIKKNPSELGNDNPFNGSSNMETENESQFYEFRG